MHSLSHGWGVTTTHLQQCWLTLVRGDTRRARAFVMGARVCVFLYALVMAGGAHLLSPTWACADDEDGRKSEQDRGPWIEVGSIRTGPTWLSPPPGFDGAGAWVRVYDFHEETGRWHVSPSVGVRVGARIAYDARAEVEESDSNGDQEAP